MELTTKTIQVTGIETKQLEFGTKYTLISGKDKYSFFDKKKDGTNSKAYDQFISFIVRVGQEYPVAVNEEEKKFTNAQGDEINYTERRIMYFVTKENEVRKAYQNVPSGTNVPKTVENVPQRSFEANKEMTVRDMVVEERLKKLEDVVFGDVPF